MIQKKETAKLKCAKCKIEMLKTGDLHSGSSVYEVYQCRACNSKITRCTGIE